MDPITQGALGAIAAQNIGKKQLIIASIFGFLSGMAPDLDVFISSDLDPLLFLEYHRQFTHSLIFIPIGGALCAALFYLFTPKKYNISFKQTWLFCSIGYATHGLLDICTSYGTQWLWPFSDVRFSWNVISIVDPIFTLPLIVLISLAIIKQKVKFSRWAIIWIIAYLLLGFVQKQRAEYHALALAETRGHQPSALLVKPSFGNIIVWKAIYEHQNKFYVDAVRVGLSSKIYTGDSIEKLDRTKSFAWLEAKGQQNKDIDRFNWFSQGFLAVHPDYPNRIIDMRYAFLPNKIDALWMIELAADKNNDVHVKYLHELKESKKYLPTFWKMLKGEAI
ncbi:metal-dependent hydrolase [Candidatus Thioglobus sp.]|uniref:metal-dependent hydrolase n=1 Tax=Candidatus Thioglobus sp. TaxID=2026721 RepID=UPI003D14A9B2